MATEADVLRSITAILQSGERREQYKVQSALAMMQFSAQQRQQDIARTQANLDLVSKSVQQQKPQVAAEFLASSGIGGIYQEGEEGDPASDAITEMAGRLRSNQYFGRKFDKAHSESIAAAVWNYYNAQDPNSILKLASDLHEASDMANDRMKEPDMTDPQRKLYQAFSDLHKSRDLSHLTTAAKKTRDAESQVRKEIFDFTKGDYDISDLSGIYSGIPEALDELDLQQRMAEKPPAAEFTEMETTRRSITEAEARLRGLQNKMDSNTATDEEKEEFLELPNLIDTFREEVGESSDSLKFSVQGEMDDLDKQMRKLQDAGLARTKAYNKLKLERSSKKSEYLDLLRKDSVEQAKKEKSDQLALISEEMGVPVSQAERYLQEDKATARLQEGKKVIFW
jgi:hypothetical protein